MKKLNNKKEQGFSILAVILLIVALIGSIGIWTLSGQTNLSDYGNSNKSVLAASLINDAAVLQDEYNKILIQGGNPRVVTDTSSILYRNPLTFSLNFQKPNINIFNNGTSNTDEKIWLLTTANGNKIGSSSLDNSFVFGGIKKDICEAINKNLNNTTNIPVSNVSFLVTGGNPALTSLAIPQTIETEGWMEGCVKSDTNIRTTGVVTYFYFKIAQVF